MDSINTIRWSFRPQALHWQYRLLLPRSFLRTGELRSLLWRHCEPNELHRRYQSNLVAQSAGTNYHRAGVKDFRRSLLIFRTIPAFRSAASLTSYSALVPRTSATSEGVSL